MATIRIELRASQEDGKYLFLVRTENDDVVAVKSGVVDLNTAVDQIATRIKATSGFKSASFTIERA